MRNDSLSLVVEFKEDAGWLGGSIYLDNLMGSLSLLPQGEQPRVQVVFLSSPVSPVATRLRKHAVVMSVYAGALSPLVIFLRRCLRSAMRRVAPLRLLETSGRRKLFFPEFDVRQPWRRRLFWIPDFQHHHLPALFAEEEISRRTRSYRAIADSNGYLLLSSQSALKDFRRFYPGARVQPRVWSFCSSTDMSRSAADVAEVREKYGLPEKFLYVANQFWEHKDHRTAFRALDLLRQRNVHVPLVCTGLQEDRRNPAYFDKLKRFVAESGLEQQVRFLGVIPREDQVQIFRCAAAIVQPSRFEGWSTVIEDAKALGRPVIASDLDVHAEQLAMTQNAYLYQAGSAEELAQSIESCWPSLRPGPDIGAEEVASEQAGGRRLASAHRFMSIAHEALA